MALSRSSTPFVEVVFSGWPTGVHERFPIKYKGHAHYNHQGKLEDGDIVVHDLPLILTEKKGRFHVFTVKNIRGSAGTLRMNVLDQNHVRRLIRDMRKLVGNGFNEKLVSFKVQVRDVGNNSNARVVQRPPRRVIAKLVQVDILARYDGNDEHMVGISGLGHTGVFIPNRNFKEAWGSLIPEAAG